MRRTLRLIIVLLTAGTIGAAITVLCLRHISATSAPVPTEVTPPQPPTYASVAGAAMLTVDLPIKSGDTLADLLTGSIDQAAKLGMIAAVEKVFDVRALRAGSQLTLTRSALGTPESLEYVIDPDHKLHVSRVDGAFAADVVEIAGTIHPVPICGTIEGSLFESIEAIGESPELALWIAKIFEYDVDFYTDPREGDEFCILIEKKEYTNGQPATYRRILAAKYDNAGALYDAFLFPDADGTARYYSHDGHSLQSLFLRSPMKFEARVSSHFSRRRFHPILKIFRPHLGTDYAAPTGTSVQAVATGRVSFSGFSGGSGNLIRIKHARGYETLYMHLSRRLVRRGQQVKQGQRIGRVGATGLATGPHLDFRVWRNGKYVNFEHLRLPRTATIQAKQEPAFDAARDRFLALMESASHTSSDIVASDTSAKNDSVSP
ncbi:MAG: peptidoglycan DD-metalloendopeptidase family protein [bacterium]|nr:peptidoglycan DD-metalloendopeptidase family protein [bacterium]